MPSAKLPFEELQTAVRMLAGVLIQHQITFGIMGGAGVALIASYHDQEPRSTSDIDLVVQADATRNISAHSVSQTLISQHLDLFGVNEVYGVAIPAVRLRRGDEEVLVDVEIFDYDTWRTRPSYNLANHENVRITLLLDQTPVSVFEPRWLLREKVILQHQRAGSQKEMTDIRDIETLVMIVAPKSLVFNQQEQIDSLQSLLGKRPDLKFELEEAIDCPQVFNSSPASP